MSDLMLHLDEVPLRDGSGATASLRLEGNRTVSVTGGGAGGPRRLARLAIGLDRPGRGRAILLGTDLATLSPRALLAYRRRVGYLPAGDGLLQNLTLGENVALPLRFGSDMSESEITSRLQIMLAAARIADAVDLRPAVASEEQRRRAALARALAFDPVFVIMEAPFVGLTENAAREILEAARGGDVGGGSRRTVLCVGPSLPGSVVRRFEERYRLARGELIREN